jgi:hypothetical protein
MLFSADPDGFELARREAETTEGRRRAIVEAEERRRMTEPVEES